MMKNFDHTLAIIGAGPRGQYALECFMRELLEVGAPLKTAITLFDDSGHSGSGPVWTLDQPDGNWSNVTERVLILPERPEIRFHSATIPAFPSYHGWAGLDFDTLSAERVDTFPPRGRIGSYLAERYQTLIDPLIEAGVVNRVHDRVDDITRSDTGLAIMTKGGEEHVADQVLLTVGHQPTVLDPQMEGWLKQSAQSTAAQLFRETYPVENIIEGVDGMIDLKVGIRGYGLATIDVLRAFAARYGRFEIDDERTRSQTYVLTEDVTLRLAPFTLDGLTMGPKPLTPKIDAQFKPSDQSIELLKKQLTCPAAQESAEDETFLLDAICPIIAEVYLRLDTKVRGAPTSQEEAARLIRAWIDDQTFAHDCILDISLPPEQVLDALINMAAGVSDITLDYCIGQVWRHCQSVIYAALSHSDVSDDALAKILSVDECMKRYAFGPPLESHQQLKALHAAGVLDLRFLDNPEIDSDTSGWTLSNGTDSFDVSVMIDAVLNAPKIKAVNSPLLTSLLDGGLLNAVHDDFGVATSSDAFVVNELDAEVPVAVLGRLAKGTVIGVDAILECFGERPEAWARTAVSRAST